MKGERIRACLKETFNASDIILAARAYGSWTYNEQTVDVDVAVMVRDQNFVVGEATYSELKNLRRKLSEDLNIDLDLIPHTLDEVGDKTSPIWYPRYNPSLVFGETLKGDFPTGASSVIHASFDFSDFAAYVMHDNRTICRRQLLRTLKDESGRIFISKLLHGPGNALTYHACKHRRKYLCSPSDLSKSLEIFDEIYGVNSALAIKFLKNCREKGIDFPNAVKLMSWYESLIAMVIMSGERSLYQHICLELNNAV